MEWRDRNGNHVSDGDEEDASLRFLYETGFGRLLLQLLVRKPVSDFVGWFMERRISALWIKGFLKRSNIDMSAYESRKFRSFNDFFTRKILPERRPVDREPGHFISPCDCKLTVFKIQPDSVFTVKGGRYTVGQLLRNDELAGTFAGGTLLIFRLTVDDYHRYCYPDSGVKEDNIHIQGIYHTVNPIAYKRYAVLKENTREYTLLHSDNFDDVILMEVGATLVGRISNLHGACRVEKGQEKGHFDFGGSTIVVILKAGVLKVDDDILRNNAEGCETVVKYGERIGVRV
ncbi:MAG: phosphatidylserine decarboxylase [Clostridia bacterium]|nr:phosphatidylserine decarboxylase [Clostridia bacterium]